MPDFPSIGHQPLPGTVVPRRPPETVVPDAAPPVAPLTPGKGRLGDLLNKVANTVKPIVNLAVEIAPPDSKVGRVAAMVKQVCERLGAPPVLSDTLQKGCEGLSPNYCRDGEPQKALRAAASPGSKEHEVLKALARAVIVLKHSADPSLSAQAAINQGHHLSGAPPGSQPAWFRQLEQQINGPGAGARLVALLPDLLQALATSNHGASSMPAALTVPYRRPVEPEAGRMTLPPVPSLPTRPPYPATVVAEPRPLPVPHPQPLAVGGR